MCDTWVIQWAQVSEWDDHHVGAMIIYFKRTKLNLRWWITCDESLFWKKNTVNKNQGWEPIHQKYKANENTSKHNPKKKQKQTINKKKSGKTLCKECSWLKNDNQTITKKTQHEFIFCLCWNLEDIMSRKLIQNFV